MPLPDPLNAGKFHTALLGWYEKQGRDLPWRQNGVSVYRVWLSEQMLQQTTVKTVIPYYRAFLKRWPDVADLAAAELDQVLHAWQGLGYYSRARKLHRAAGVVMDDFKGKFPDSEQGLLMLPGVGPYTAAAIAAIAYDHGAVPVDGNIERVMARLFNVRDNVREKSGKQRIRQYAEMLTPNENNCHWVQALMDLGAMVCRAKKPTCGICPLQELCQGRQAGDVECLPLKPSPKPRPRRYGTVYWLERECDGAVLLRRRPDRGLLGGMMELPSSPWRDTERPPSDTDWNGQPERMVWTPVPGLVRHVFTHFDLRLSVVRGVMEDAYNLPEHGIWCLPADFSHQALPTVMKKVIAHIGGPAESETIRV